MEKCKKCIWLFGCGASYACNLRWTVPLSWQSKPREEQINLIEKVLSCEMKRPEVNTKVYKDLLSSLSKRTDRSCFHQFITTNWDYLLQREIQDKNFKVAPKWLPETHVSHLNGTIEKLKDNSNRSSFLLETDPTSARVLSVEANEAFNAMLVCRLFIVIGMSFECEIDKGLLSAFRKEQDRMPVGKSEWIIINPDFSALDKVSSNINIALPTARTIKKISTFQNWLKEGMVELKARGVLID